MSLCPSCGAQVPDGASFCPNCGVRQLGAEAQQPGWQQPEPGAYQSPEGAPQSPYSQGINTYQQYEQPQFQNPQFQQPYQQFYQEEDSGSFGWAVLGFLIPIVGLVLYLVWRDRKPKCARQAGMGALVSVILSVALSILGSLLGSCALLFSM